MPAAGDGPLPIPGPTFRNSCALAPDAPAARCDRQQDSGKFHPMDGSGHRLPPSRKAPDVNPSRRSLKVKGTKLDDLWRNCALAAAAPPQAERSNDTVIPVAIAARDDSDRAGIAPQRHVLMVTRIDRLARSTGNRQDILRTISARGASLKATEQPIAPAPLQQMPPFSICATFMISSGPTRAGWKI